MTERWDAAIESLRKELSSARDKLGGVRAEWESRRAARAAEFDRALRELQERMPDVDPERYLDVERRIEQLTPLRAALVELRARLEAAAGERVKLLIELEDVRGAKHRVRQRAAERLTTATEANVKVELAHRADRQDFIDRLAALKTGARADSLRRMVEAPELARSPLRVMYATGRWWASTACPMDRRVCSSGRSLLRRCLPSTRSSCATRYLSASTLGWQAFVNTGHSSG